MWWEKENKGRKKGAREQNIWLAEITKGDRQRPRYYFHVCALSFSFPLFSHAEITEQGNVKLTFRKIKDRQKKKTCWKENYLFSIKANEVTSTGWPNSWVAESGFNCPIQGAEFFIAYNPRGVVSS